MKKRILSLLMLVVMVMTALPLTALTVFATTEFKKEDYNALYVQDGLVWAVDFFDTNANWGGEAEALGSTTAIAEAIKSRVWHDVSAEAATKIGVSVGFGSGVSSITLMNGYLPAQGVGAGGYLEITGVRLYAPSQSGATRDTVMNSTSASNTTLAYNNVGLIFGSGKLSTIYGAYKKGDTGNDFPSATVNSTVAAAHNGKPAGVTITMTVPAGFTKEATWNESAANLLEYSYIGEYIEGEDGARVLSVTPLAATKKVMKYYAPNGLETVTTAYLEGVKQDAETTYTNVFVPEHNMTAGGEFAYYENAALVYEKADDELFYPQNKVVYTGATYWKVGWRTGASIYADRYYNRTLTADEIAQNHLADLLKWFKVDITEVKLLNDLSLSELVNDPDIKALNFQSDAATVETIVKEKAAYLLSLQHETTPELDYNSLYVQEGLVFAADFFATNSVWGETTLRGDFDDYVWTDTTAEGAANFSLSTIPTGAISGGALLLNKLSSDLAVTNSGTLTNFAQGGTTGEYVGTFTSAGADVFALNGHRARVYLSELNGKRALDFISLGFYSSTTMKFRTGDGKVVAFKAPVADKVISTMTMTVDVTTFTQNYYGTYPMLRFDGVKATDSQVSGLSPASTSWQAYFYQTHTYDEATGGVKPLAKVTRPFWPGQTPKYVTTDMIWDEATQTYVKDPEGEKTYIVGGIYRDGGDGDVTADFMKNNAYGADGERENDNSFYTTEPGHLGVYVNGAVAYASDDVYFPNNKSSNIGGGNTSLRKQAMTAGTNLYAFRQYNRVISADEMARNRLADLAKWFKVDLTYVVSLSDEMLVRLANDPAVRALTFESNGAFVAAVIREKARALFLEQYAGEVDRDVALTLAHYGIEGSALFGYPKGVLADAYAFLFEGIRESEDAVSDFAAAVAEDKVAYDNAIGGLTAEQYDALYVQKDLRFAMDFFPMNRYWNPAGEGYIDYAAKVPLGPDEGGTLTKAEWAKEDNAFIDSFITYRESTSLRLAPWSSSAPAGKQVTFYTVGDGYIKIRPTGGAGQPDGSGYMSFIGPSNYKTFGEHTMQLTAKTGYLGTQPVSYLGIRVTNSTGAVSAGFTASSTPSAPSVPSYYAKTLPLNYTLVNTAGTDTYRITGIDKTYYSVTGTYPANFSEWTAIGWSNAAKDMQIYALRYYTADLTAEERAQNNFADLAKFFRLNLLGFEMLTEAEKQAVYNATVGFDLTTPRETVVNAVMPLVTPIVFERAPAYYAELKGDDATENAFLDLAAEYLLDRADLEDLLASRRDVSSVYRAVNADALIGKSYSLAQENFEKAIFSAWHYLSYTVSADAERADEWNAKMAEYAGMYGIDSYVDLEELMSLPYAERLGALDIAVGTVEQTQAAIDAYVAEAMAAYNALEMADYNDLYVRDGLVYAMDFFDTNAYWSGKPVTLTSAAEVNAAINSRAWHNMETNPIMPATSWTSGSAGVTIADGHFNTAGVTQLNFSNVGLHTNYSLGAGSSFDMMIIVPTNMPMIFNNFRPFFETYSVSGATVLRFTKANFQDHNIFPPITYPKHEGQNVYFSMNTVPTNFTLALNIKNAEYNHAWAGNNVKVSYRVGTYVKGENGEDVISVSSTEAEEFRFYFPAGLRTVTTTYVDGVNTGTETTYNNVYIAENHIIGGKLAMYENGNVRYDNDAAPFLNTKNEQAHDGVYWRWSQLKLDVYAARYYDRLLTADEAKQNHFADLAKWFRMDLGAVKRLNGDSLAALYAYAADFTVNTANAAAELEAKAQALFKAQTGKTLEEYYAATAEKVGEDFAILAAENNLDLDRLLTIKEAESIKVITDAILADFPVGYAANEYVVRDVLKDALAFLDSIDFIGAQVRIDSPYDTASYPGIRAVFHVGEEELKTLLAAGEKVVIGARVFGVYEDENGEKQRTKGIVLTFEPSLDDKGNLVFPEGSKLDWMPDPNDPDNPEKDTLTFVYTVTYKSWFEKTAEDRAASANREVDYEFFVTLNGTTYTREVDFDQFGGSVSAADVYRYYYNMEDSEYDYKSDKVVSSVIEAVGAVAQ